MYEKHILGDESVKQKRVWIILASVIAAASALSYILILSEKNAAESESSQPVSDVYRVSQFNGKIAVFKNESEEPVEVLDAYISSFPEQDRILLEQGIYAENESELQKIIEDYTS